MDPSLIPLLDAIVRGAICGAALGVVGYLMHKFGKKQKKTDNLLDK
jgi:hypothetical protein